MASNKLRTRIVYTSEAVDQMTDAEVRKAYTSIRHIAVERFQRLGKYGFTNTQTYKEAADIGFPKLSHMSPSQARQTLLDTSLWLRSPYSKVTRMQKRNREALSSFKEMHYDFLNMGNINDALNFLNDMMEKHDDLHYSYVTIMKAYDEAQRLNIPAEYLRTNFKAYMANLDKISDIALDAEGRDGKTSSEQVDDLISRYNIKAARQKEKEAYQRERRKEIYKKRKARRAKKKAGKI